MYFETSKTKTGKDEGKVKSKKWILHTTAKMSGVVEIGAIGRHHYHSI